MQVHVSLFHDISLHVLIYYRIYAGAFAAQGILEGKATLGADKDAQVRRLVEAQPSGQTNTYHTDYSYFVAASVLELVCIILIAPTYWGWWRIGRPVSFSPLEIAKVKHRHYL